MLVELVLNPYSPLWILDLYALKPTNGTERAMLRAN
jgi:hypothetical protein